ncbi:unnamed protein product, partial [Polarella glacialis]
MFIVRNRISEQADAGGKVYVPAEGWLQAAVVKQMGVEVKPAMEQTTKEYDLAKWSEQMQQLTIGFLMLSFFHARMGYVIPLALQLYTTPLQ